MNHPNLRGRLHAACGHNTFVNAECIRRGHVGDELNPLLEDLEMQNRGMKAVRKTIEHGFREQANNFTICNQFNEFKLHQRGTPHATHQLIACFLFTNILNTFNGSQVSARDAFLCNAPSFEENIELGDE